MNMSLIHVYQQKTIDAINIDQNFLNFAELYKKTTDPCFVNTIELKTILIVSVLEFMSTGTIFFSSAHKHLKLHPYLQLQHE